MFEFNNRSFVLVSPLSRRRRLLILILQFFFLVLSVSKRSPNSILVSVFIFLNNIPRAFFFASVDLERNGVYILNIAIRYVLPAKNGRTLECKFTFSNTNPKWLRYQCLQNKWPIIIWPHSSVTLDFEILSKNSGKISLVYAFRKLNESSTRLSHLPPS